MDIYLRSVDYGFAVVSRYCANEFCRIHAIFPTRKLAEEYRKTLGRKTLIIRVDYVLSWKNRGKRHGPINPKELQDKLRVEQQAELKSWHDDIFKKEKQS